MRKNRVNTPPNRWFALCRGKPPKASLWLVTAAGAGLCPAVLISFILALAAAGLVFAGGQGEGSSAGTVSAVIGSGSGADFSYPVKTGGKLSYWEQVQAVWSANYANLGDTPFAQKLMEKTGIEIKFLHPPATSPREAFNLMVADGNFPDIVQWNFHTSYSGGPTKALDDKIVIPLNDVIDQWAPNLKAYLKDHPDIDKSIKTDAGQYYTFPFVRGHERLQFSSGLIIRKDWLDELGLALPSTIDEVHNVLAAFKQRKGAAAPYTAETGATGGFLYAFGQEGGFYVHDDGRIHHGVLEPGYRGYLETMARWYKEGLLDLDLFSQTFETVSMKMTSGVSGMSSGSVNSRMITWNNAARKTNPAYTVVMIASLAQSKGAQPDTPARISPSEPTRSA